MLKAMKSVSIAALLGSLVWRLFARDQMWSVQVGGYLELLALVVWFTALIVVAQTVLTQKYFWAAGFVSIAVLFNPVAPIRLSRLTFLILDSFCILAFVLAMAVLQTEPKRDLAFRSLQ
jgi:hypothetical protein